jgi:glycosyltransferase involved in cell wall biosynthesis
MPTDLIVFSHLRWVWVWQRPQHLVSRVGAGGKIWFVEEPWPSDVDAPEIRREDTDDGVTRIWLAVPDEGHPVGFDDWTLPYYQEALPGLVETTGRRVVWLYSPLVTDVATGLDPDVVVYDVMDDLATFKDAPVELAARHLDALRRADVVFAGGRSLHDGVLPHRRDAHLFPSGVDPEHYEAARRHQRTRERPVAGYVGVIDERLDLDLIGGLATALPDWDIHMVGPVTKISEDSVPTAPNITYLGKQPYERLPELMGAFDVALMPFPLDETTKSISPTKTLEYLAAGLPVVSTPVPDVVAGFSALVDLREGPTAFAEGCRHVLGHERHQRDLKLAPTLHGLRWDTIAARMSALIQEAASGEMASRRSA